MIHILFLVYALLYFNLCIFITVYNIGKLEQIEENVDNKMYYTYIMYIINLFHCHLHTCYHVHTLKLLCGGI